MRETSTQREQHTAAMRRAGRVRKAGVLGFLLLCASAIGQSIDPYGSTLDRHFGATNSGPDENQMTGAQIKMLDFENALKARTRAMSQSSPVPTAPPHSAREMSLTWTAVALPCLAFVGIGVLGYVLKLKLDARLRASEEAHERRLQEIGEDAGLEGFFIELRDALEGPKPAPEPTGAPADRTKTGPEVAALKEFIASAAGRTAGLRALVSNLGGVAGEIERRKVLTMLCDQVGSFKEIAGKLDLHPVWIMACALEGLWKQLSRDTASLTESTQCTAMAGVDLLGALCIPDLNPEFATRPAVRILAVDDDPISRRAISFALKKAFDEPTLAPDGNTALELTVGNEYDVIFLDVEMPGMDGFELCTGIRETERNGTTPVVFVTRHSDFESRKKSARSGGQDLIAKPYHSFEITVKALTLVLRNRLQKGAVATSDLPMVAPAKPGDSPSPLPVAEPAPAEPPRRIEEARRQDAHFSVSGPPTLKGPHATNTSTGSEAAKGSPGESGQLNVSRILSPPAERLPDTFSAWSPVYLETLRDQLHVATLCTVPEHLQELVTGLYLSVHSFSVESEHAGLPTVHRFSSALEGMLKKLMEKPKFCSPSVWNTARAAMELLSEMPGRAADIPDFSNRPARILVVDDDPVARRAISGAIQLVFGRPEQADNGEAAVVMSSEAHFDLIFVDILMPGIDGFKTCSKIRETKLNQGTPVVFISNHDDAVSREKAAMSGGSGFIPKPVFSSQITLAALTSILRNRLRQTKTDVIVAVEQVVAVEQELVS